jgi:predicted RecB family nuclease
MIMAVSIELGKKLDKDYENKSLEEILDAPPSALAGLTDKHAELLAGLGIKTVRDLGSNKYFAVAGVLGALSNHTD